MGHLQQRCRLFLIALGEKDTQVTGAKMSHIVNECIRHMSEVLEILSKLSSYNFLKAFSRKNEISDDIKWCHQKIDDCCTYFEIKSNIELHQWKETFNTFMKEDWAELHDKLFETNDNILELKRDVLEIKLLLAIDQEELGKYPPDSAQHLALQWYMYRISKYFGELPPNIDLKSGEVRRIGKHPVGGTTFFDIFEGKWLERDKVALKAVREARGSSEKWERFKKEAQIWKDVGNSDDGRHILPFYGAFLDDGQVPCLVSPWMENGNVIEYLEKNPTANRLTIVKGIARCVRFLHNFQPNAIVHGDIKANILITDSGQPLLAEFGLSQVIDNVNGAQLTRSNGLTESYRWAAPEICKPPGVLSVHSDVYSYAMTVVQVMTGKIPFSNVVRNTEVMFMILDGKRPVRPTEEVLERGLDDRLWSVLCDCWKTDPQQRPTIDDILAQL